MKYYYNESENSLYITTNFEPKEIPQGYVEITKEQYEELIKEQEETKPKDEVEK